MTAKQWRFTHNQAADATWAPGMRSIFDYRDLDIQSASNGDYIAHVIRANGIDHSDNVQQWHVHDCNFQMIYVLNGSATFEYEGHGEHTLVKGDSVLQPPMIRHREISCSADFEVLEVVSPANFKTHLVEAPK